MNFDLVDTFLLLAKTRSFSRTAELLFVSQSTVTARIKLLEEELGKELFIRDSKNIRLTTPGEIFQGYAIKISKLSVDSKQAVKNFDRYKYLVSVAAPDSVWRYSLLDPVNRYMDANPDIAFSFTCGHSEYILRDLMDGVVDVGVTFSKPYYTDIEVIQYFESTFHLVARPELIPENMKITAQNIREYPMIYMGWGPEFGEWYLKHYRYKNYFLEVEREFLFIDLLLAGKGFGFLPDRSAQKYLESGALVSIQYEFMEKAPKDSAYLLYLKKNKEKVCSLVEIIAQNSPSSHLFEQ